MADHLPERATFDARVMEELGKRKNEEMSDITTPERYAKLIEEVKQARDKPAKNRTTTKRRRLKRYAVIDIQA